MSTFESKLIKENQNLLKKLDQQTQRITQQDQQITEQTQQITEQTLKIQQLTEQVAFLTKKLFGSSSEKTKVDPNQLSLFEDPHLENHQTKIEPTEEITYRRRKASGRKAELTKDLPVEEIHCELHGEDCTCDYCGQKMKPMGKKLIREEVCFIPAKLFKKVYYSHAYKCDCHDDSYEPQPIQCAEVPKGPIQRSLAGPSVLAWMIHQKYELSLPLYRQEKEWKTYGLELNRRTMANWMIKVANDWLRPLYDYFAKILVKEEVLHADETHYQVLNRTDGRDATSQARIWLIQTGKECETPIVYYHADLTRARVVAEQLLDGFKGYLHCDGYSGYKNLPNIELVGCWAHARRKFKDVPGKNGKAKQAIDYCNQIFKIERALQGLSPEERYEQRQLQVKPVIEAFYDFLGSFIPMKGKLQTAVHYVLNQKKELMAFLKDGRLEASNNRAERAIKTVVIGRKNYLFSTSLSGAEANAIIYSVIP